MRVKKAGIGGEWRRHVLWSIRSCLVGLNINSLARAIIIAPKSSCITSSLRSFHWLKIKERIDYKILSLTYKVLPYYYRTILSLWSYLSSTTSQHLLFLWCCHPCSSTFLFLFESQQLLFPPCLTLSLEMNFSKNFAKLSIDDESLSSHLSLTGSSSSPSSSSLSLCITPDSKLTFSINPSHHSLCHLFGRISWIFMTISGLNCSLVCSFLLLF